MEKEIKWLAVTGGSKGIGKAIILSFMQAGFHVITCARNQKELAELKGSLEKQFEGQKVETFVADLSRKEEAIAFGNFVLSITDRLDVLVNNAGYFIPGQIHNEEEGTLESMVAANLGSAYHVTRSLLGAFIKQQNGHVFTICSTASIMPYVNGGSYCISKYALLGFTKVLREEMKPHGVRVTAILPGATRTASWDGVDLPEDRFMKASDVGHAVLSCWQLSHHAVVEELLLRPQLGDI